MAGIESVHLPTDSSPGQMFGAWATLLARFGYEFGEILDFLMSQQVGGDWLDRVIAQRTQQDGRLFRADLHDISFVLGEPVKQDSLVRRALPRDGAWIPLFNRVRHLRNDWMHRNVAWSLEQLEIAVDALHALVGAVSPKLPVGESVRAMNVRIFDLREAGGAIPDPQIEEMARLLDEAQDQAEAARTRATDLGRQLEELAGQAEAGEAALSALRDQLRRAEEDADSARARMDRLRREVEERGTSQRRGHIQPPPDLRPGDPWTLPRGVRHMHLQRRPAVGLFDLDRGEFVGGEFERAAKSAAERWLRVMPLGGDIWVTDTWHAAGMVGLTLTYLGRLDQEAPQLESIGAPITSVLTPHVYSLTDAGQILTEEGSTLADQIGVAGARHVLDELGEGIRAARESSGLPADQPMDLRVTYDGAVAAPFGDEERGYVGRVAASSWFPGHL